MSEGIDYSVARPNPDRVVAAGKTFVCRYLAHLPNAKVISATELFELHSAGLGVVFNWEQASGDALQGRARGVAHATEALRQMNALHVPASIPCYFSVDFDATAMGSITAYFDGVASVIGIHRTGVYGEADVIDAMLPNHATWGWETYAWSHNRTSGKAHLYQYLNRQTVAGIDCDLDRSLKDNYGAWFAPRKEHTMISLNGLALPALQHGDDDAHFTGYHHVTRVQGLLNTVWHKGLTVDGVYGDKTAVALHEVLGSGGQFIGLGEWTQLYGLSHG